MLGYPLQYHIVFQRLKRLIAAGEPGRIQCILFHRLDFGKMRREEKIVRLFVATKWGAIPSWVLALLCRQMSLTIRLS